MSIEKSFGILNIYGSTESTEIRKVYFISVSFKNEKCACFLREQELTEQLLHRALCYVLSSAAVKAETTYLSHENFECPPGQKSCHRFILLTVF